MSIGHITAESVVGSVSGAIKSYNGFRAGAAAGSTVKYFDYVQLKTEPNTAYFWSGMGDDGASIAANIAKKNSGVTLEITKPAKGCQALKSTFLR